MSRTKGSKNRPKFAQMIFNTTEIGDGTLMSPEEIRKIENLEQYEVTSMEITHSLKLINQGNFPEIEQDIKTRFFDKGWRLFATHFGGMQPEGMIIIYIFIREQ